MSCRADSCLALWERVLDRPFYGIRYFPHYLMLMIRDLKEKSRRDSVLKFCAGGGTPKTTLGIRECTKFKVGITGVKDHSWGPLLGGNWMRGQCSEVQPVILSYTLFDRKGTLLGVSPPPRDSDVKNARSVPTFPDRARPIFP